jgi:hypothetical protein
MAKPDDKGAAYRVAIPRGDRPNFLPPLRDGRDVRYSNGRLKLSYTDGNPADAFSIRENRGGWHLGGGVEAMLAGTTNPRMAA